MAVIKMVALTMLGPIDEMEPVARSMVLMGGFQPIPVDYLINNRSIRSKINTVSENPYEGLLSRLSLVWRVAGKNLPQAFPVPIDPTMNLRSTEIEVERITKKLEIWDARKEALLNEIEELEATQVYIESLDQLNFGVYELAQTEFAITYFGRFSVDNFSRLVDSSEDSPLLPIELMRKGENVWALIMTVPGYKENAEKVLNSVYFKNYPLIQIAEKLNPKNPSEQISQRINNAHRAVEGLSQAAKKLLQTNQEVYEKLFSSLYTMQRVYDLCAGRGEICDMYVLSGWIPADTLADIRSTVEKEAPLTSLIVEDVSSIPYSGIRIPTLLSNSKLVRAFQDVVSMYSVPSYGDVDPSPIVALTFIFFFGFMFGDVGHGLVVLLGALYCEKKRIIKRSSAYIGKAAALSSIFFGFLYGSVMGYENIIPALWLSPMHDTGKLMGVAILVGIGMVSLGMFLNMLSLYREGDFGRLLFDGQGAAGLIMYWTLVVAAYITATHQTLPFPRSWLLMGTGLLALIILLRDVLARVLLRQKKPHGEKESIGMQAFEILHSLMSFLSNTASFVRLAAFAMNHVGLSMAVLAISDVVHRLPGGIVFKVIVLVLGNILIIAMEGMIVAIQTLRLEYYEFFSRFYKGGGNAFKPITWDNEKATSFPRKN